LFQGSSANSTQLLLEVARISPASVASELGASELVDMSKRLLTAQVPEASGMWATLTSALSSSNVTVAPAAAATGADPKQVKGDEGAVKDMLMHGDQGMSTLSKAIVFFYMIAFGLLFTITALLWSKRGRRSLEKHPLSVMSQLAFFLRVDFWGLLWVIVVFVLVTFSILKYIETGNVDTKGVPDDKGKSREDVLSSLLEGIAFMGIATMVFKAFHNSSGGMNAVQAEAMITKYNSDHERFKLAGKPWLKAKLLDDILMKFVSAYDIAEVKDAVTAQKCSLHKGLEEFLRLQENRRATEDFVQAATTVNLCKIYYDSSRLEWVFDQIQWIQSIFVQMALVVVSSRTII